MNTKRIVTSILFVQLSMLACAPLAQADDGNERLNQIADQWAEKARQTMLDKHHTEQAADTAAQQMRIMVINTADKELPKTISSDVPGTPCQARCELSKKGSAVVNVYDSRSGAHLGAGFAYEKRKKKYSVKTDKSCIAAATDMVTRSEVILENGCTQTEVLSKTKKLLGTLDGKTFHAANP